MTISIPPKRTRTSSACQQPARSMNISNPHLTNAPNTGKISPRARAHITRGDVAQLGEHHVRNVGVVGSNPIISTTEIKAGRETGLLFWSFRQRRYEARFNLLKESPVSCCPLRLERPVFDHLLQMSARRALCNPGRLCNLRYRDCVVFNKQSLYCRADVRPLAVACGLRRSSCRRSTR